MDWAEISRLAALLREKGDEILCEHCKFVLSTSLLTDLNEAFLLLADQRDSMSNSFSVLSSSNVNVEIFRNLQFLHDFMQSTTSLKLVNKFFGQVDNDIYKIDKFKNLKYLELNKVKCCNVQGIQALRSQLQYLTCTKSLTEIGEVLVKCGADLSQGVIWNELKEVVLKHNNLESIDTSFSFTPWLHTLDLSHNEIQDIRPLNCLYNLKYLNLGYNKLTTIPTFTGQICNRLQVIILCNNFIEDVTGLIVLVNICELDLGDNCLMQHNLLTPLANLATLQWLNLEGNPISYHIEHRILTSYNLHRNTATVRFILDRKVMTKTEMKYVGSLHPIQAKMPTSLSTSASSSSVNTSLVERGKRARQATISDEFERPTIDESIASISSLVTSSDHLETRRQLVELREKFGSNWLYKEGGSLVQDILGMPKPSYPVTSSPYEADFLIHAREVVEAREAKPETVEETKTETPVKNSSNGNTEDTKSEGKGEDSNNTSDPIEQTTTYESATDHLSGEDDGLYPDENASVSSVESTVEIDVGDETVFLVTPRGQKDTILFIVTDKIMTERDAMVKAKKKTKWDLDTLVSCQFVEGDPSYAQLEFDTLRNDKKSRQYIIDDPEHLEKFMSTMKDVIDKRPPEKLTCYNCMKCSSSFGIEKSPRSSYKETVIECPKCFSSLVIEED